PGSERKSSAFPLEVRFGKLTGHERYFRSYLLVTFLAFFAVLFPVFLAAFFPAFPNILEISLINGPLLCVHISDSVTK
ncbi:hypothetical protein, partial [Paenibacillus popilliae]|uniref:hypothetical protein n=1 Tax=Paenibacillus popilliae TaxID=78057 RepID=UPI001F3E6F67